MKYIAICILLFACHFAGPAQTKTDYERVMAAYMKYHNNVDSAGMTNLWPVNKRAEMSMLYSVTLASQHREYGDIKSFKYIGQDTTTSSKSTVFWVNFFQTAHAMSFALDSNNHICIFRFKIWSPAIEKMLSAAR